MGAPTGEQMADVTDRRWEGRIKSLSKRRHFGFIENSNLNSIFGGDIFLRKRDVELFEVGDVVSFSVSLKENGKPQAMDVERVGEAGHDGDAGDSRTSRSGAPPSPPARPSRRPPPPPPPPRMMGPPEDDDSGGPRKRR